MLHVADASEDRGGTGRAFPAGLRPNRSRPRDRDPVSAYLSGLSETAQRTQGLALELIAQVASAGLCSAETLPWEQFRRQDSLRLRDWLSSKYSVSTTERHLAALRGVLREAWCLRLMSASSYYRASLLAVRARDGVGLTRAAGQGELRAMLSACHIDASPVGFRDAAILHLVFRSGVRPADMVALVDRDYDATRGELRLPRGAAAASVRRAILAPTARQALNVWWTYRSPDQPALLQRLTENGAGSPMRACEVAQAVRRRAAEAGLGGSWRAWTTWPGRAGQPAS